MDTTIATPVRSDYHLTDAQLAFFDEHGYLVLRNWTPPEMLAELQQASERWITRGHQATAQDADYQDYMFAARPNGRVMFRVNYLYDKGEPVALALLGSPQVLAVAESMCGSNFVPTYESMVFKQTGDGEAIAWHQDAVHPGTNRFLTSISTWTPHTKGLARCG